MPRHQYFASRGTFSTDSLIVPEKPLYLRNDAYKGLWYLGETCYGRQLRFICLKFSRRIVVQEFDLDSLGVVKPGLILGQLWFIPVQAGKSPNGQSLPTNLVFYTLLRNFQDGRLGSLLNFEQKAVLAQSQGYDFREIVWTAAFHKKLARIRKIRYLVLDFGYSEPDEVELVQMDRLVTVLESPMDMARLHDPVLDAVTQCVDEPSQWQLHQA